MAMHATCIHLLMYFSALVILINFDSYLIPLHINSSITKLNDFELKCMVERYHEFLEADDKCKSFGYLLDYFIEYVFEIVGLIPVLLVTLYITAQIFDGKF